MRLRPGLKLNSRDSIAQVIVIRAPSDDVDIRCGGAPMVLDSESTLTDLDGRGEMLLMGKRYGDADGALELLCTKPGAGPLAVGDHELSVKAARPLPASD
ncbi:hypothetical protein ACXPWS_15935 [Mycobacterium sp. BMJ-28]